VELKKSFANGLSRLTVRENYFEIEAWSEWTDTQAMDSDGNYGKSPSCIHNHLNSTNSLIRHEDSGLVLDPRVGEIPSKGGMEVKVFQRKEPCLVGNVLMENLEGVGCLAVDVREFCSVVVVGVGEVNMHVEYEA
jgi:hypothetical protein